MLTLWCLDKYRDKLPNFAFHSPPRPLNLTVLKADITKTSSEQFLFIFVCRTSKNTRMQKKK